MSFLNMGASLAQSQFQRDRASQSLGMPGGNTNGKDPLGTALGMPFGNSVKLDRGQNANWESHSPVVVDIALLRTREDKCFPSNLFPGCFVFFERQAKGLNQEQAKHIVKCIADVNFQLMAQGDRFKTVIQVTDTYVPAGVVQSIYPVTEEARTEGTNVFLTLVTGNQADMFNYWVDSNNFSPLSECNLARNQLPTSCDRLGLYNYFFLMPRFYQQCRIESFNQNPKDMTRSDNGSQLLERLRKMTPEPLRAATENMFKEYLQRTDDGARYNMTSIPTMLAQSKMIDFSFDKDGEHLNELYDSLSKEEKRNVFKPIMYLSALVGAWVDGNGFVATNGKRASTTQSRILASKRQKNFAFGSIPPGVTGYTPKSLAFPETQIIHKKGGYDDGFRFAFVPASLATSLDPDIALYSDFANNRIGLPVYVGRSGIIKSWIPEHSIGIVRRHLYPENRAEISSQIGKIPKLNVFLRH